MYHRNSLDLYVQARAARSQEIARLTGLAFAKGRQLVAKLALKLRSHRACPEL